MFCESFLECGGCQISQEYTIQFEKKLHTFLELFHIKDQDVEKFLSPASGFRARAEFRLHTENDKIYLSMNAYGKNHRVKIISCPIILPHLQDKLKILLTIINKNPIIRYKLYGVRVLGGISGETIITLIYHKKLDQDLQKTLAKLTQKLQCSIIGRSKGEKITIGKDFINEILCIDKQEFFYIQQEGRFSQPNPYINIQMIQFVLSKLPLNIKSDLLEMYCGSGNFTIPLSKRFRKVFATEVVKSAIKTLEQNAQKNQIHNITCARLSGAETIEALNRERDFFRLREINLNEFNFSHILLDPPRSGINDANMLTFIQKFDVIIYISCNPLSLKEDLKILQKTHKIEHCGIFDQFPYTHHLECGLILKKF
ncbi:tRNA (uridine(54)-C5)-methyltransferase TrmA [Helicobacter sp. 13S00482-2]|uniref:tRNA (uridine(54)-C5)-methyltransferase TrmA n=1 Tax=Helicobacter sp. 13S00482-2 TaxID=1476200 RepID=UPI000BA797EB|nr:tRNA (uridine(54)-C5)-methyltransferase TrmA [Helicobacter sp. 13S00482-2]PAF53212.1 tRNA (uridine(54)-C5)-methyltransferase TrmA [Helicobacter sp. 13S00482-2]